MPDAMQCIEKRLEFSRQKSIGSIKDEQDIAEQTSSRFREDEGADPSPCKYFEHETLGRNGGAFPETHEDISPPPDGGFQAWTQVVVGWLIIFTTWGWVNSYGVFQTYYELNLPESSSTISWIGSILNWFTFFVGMFSGRLLDAGLLRPTIAVGAIIQVLGIFMMSLSTKYWQFMITQGIMTGLGNGIMFTPSIGVVGTYFSKKRALAIGLSTMGNAVGGAIYPIIVQQLLPKIGFPWTVRVLGFFNFTCLVLVLCFVRPRLPPRKSGPVMDLAAFKEVSYTTLVLGLVFMTWAIYYTFDYLSSFALEVIGFSESESITVTIVINAVGVPARVIPPFLADHVGQFNVMLPTVVVMSIVAFCWIAVSDASGLWAFTCFYGLTSAAYQCIIPSTVATVTPEMNRFGTRLGMAFSLMSFGALTGPPIGGAIQNADGGRYLVAQLWAGVTTLICLGFVSVARYSRCGLNPTAKC